MISQIPKAGIGGAGNERIHSTFPRRRFFRALGRGRFGFLGEAPGIYIREVIVMLYPASQRWGNPYDGLHQVGTVLIDLSFDQGFVVRDAIAEILDGCKAVMKRLSGNLCREAVPQVGNPELFLVGICEHLHPEAETKLRHNMPRAHSTDAKRDILLSRVDIVHFPVTEWELIPPRFCPKFFGHLGMHAVSKSDLEGLNDSIKGGRKLRVAHIKMEGHPMIAA